VSSSPANQSNHQVDQKLAYQFLDGDLNTGLSSSRVQGLIQATEVTTGVRNTIVAASQALSGTLTARADFGSLDGIEGLTDEL
jgi:hypothetical protein